MKNTKGIASEKKIPVIIIKPHKYDPLENYERDFAPTGPVPLHALWRFDLGRREPTLIEITTEEKRDLTHEPSDEIEIVHQRLSVDGFSLADWDRKLASVGYGKDVTLTPVSNLEKALENEKEKQRQRSKRRISHVLGSAGSIDDPDNNQRRQKSIVDFSNRSTPSDLALFDHQEIPRRQSERGSKSKKSASFSVSSSRHDHEKREGTTSAAVEEEATSPPQEVLSPHFQEDEQSLAIKPTHHRIQMHTSTGKRTTEEIMRRLTIDSVKSHELQQHYFDYKWAKGVTGSRPWITDQMDKIRKLSAESRSMNLPSKFFIRDHILDGFCYRNRDKTKDLVMRGREVYRIIGRRVSDFDLPHIFDYLNQHPNIVTLDLCYNSISNAGFEVISAYLSWNETLRSVNLMNNDFTRISGAAINSLCVNKTLKSLRVNGNNLGPKGGQYLSFLIMFKKIEHLDIGQTNQTLASLAWIGQAVANAQKLKILDASRLLGYPQYITDSLNISITFGDILRFSKTLVELHLPKNNINDYDLEHLLWGFRFNKTLEVLDLSCNCIADDGTEKLADSLNFGAPLKALMLASNHIGDRGARALSFKLPFSQIKLLDVTKNRIRDQGILDIVHTLRKPTPLVALFIFGNHFKEESLKALENKINTGIISVKSLDVHVYWSSNQIGHGHNPKADRYRARYYGVPASCRAELFGRKRNFTPTCWSGCLFYQFHNAVNPIKPEKTRLKLAIYQGEGQTCSS